MSNPVAPRFGIAPVAADGDRPELVGEAQKIVERTRAALLEMRVRLEESARLLAELARISSVFDNIGDRLMKATFKASGDVTRGLPSQVVLISFVEELATLSRLALGGAADLRRELRARIARPAPGSNPFLETELALRELSASLQRLTARAVQPPALTIEIEDRSARTPGTPPPFPRLTSPPEPPLPPPPPGKRGRWDN